MNAKLLVPLCLLAAACGVDNGSSIVIAGRIASPAATSTTTSCTFQPGTFSVGPGTFDIRGVGLYQLVMEVDNNLVDPTTSGGAAGTRTWSARAARVRVVNSSEFNPPLPNVPSQNTLPADSTAIVPGAKAPIGLTAIGTDFAQQIAATVGPSLGAGQIKMLQLGITLLGKTGDGQELDTAERTYPIEVCNGCLVYTPLCVAPAVAKPLPSCFPLGEDQAAYTCQ